MKLSKTLREELHALLYGRLCLPAPFLRQFYTDRQVCELVRMLWEFDELMEDAEQQRNGNSGAA